MLRNYLITAYRNLIRQKGTSMINILGLTLGISCSLVLFLLISHLTSFDNFHSKAERIFRVVTESDGNNGREHSGGIPSTLPDAFRTDFTEAEEVAFVSYRRDAVILVPQEAGEMKKFKEEDGVTFSDANIFKIFDRNVVSGDLVKGLDEPYEAVISKSLANKYFQTQDVIGKVIKYDTLEYKITAVVDDAPVNTDVPFNLLLSYSTIKKQTEENGWGSIWSDEQCYILLKENEKAATIESRMPAFVDKYIGKDNFNHRTFKLQALTELHFDSEYGTLSDQTASKETLIALSVVGIFLILTACINFINLSTAEAIKRSKEVGIRKSLGSSRGQLVAQFMGETTIITTIAMIFSISLSQLLLSFLSAFLDRQIPMNFNDPLLWIFIIGITVVVAFLSGLYPSIIISGYKPALALKNFISSKSSSGYNLRRSLVVLQFVISQFFIIGTIVLIQQMDFFRQKDLGFRKDGILIIPIPESEAPGGNDGLSKMRTLRDELTKDQSIVAASLSNFPPSSGAVSGTFYRWEGEDESLRRKAQIKAIDGNYVSLFNLKLVAGADLTDGDTATGFIVNEQFVKANGFTAPQEVIGKRMYMWRQTLPIVGVVKDFHTMSLSAPIEPTVLLNRIRNYGTLSLQVNGNNIQQTIDRIKTKWEAAYPAHIFEYRFLDDNIRRFYEGEEKMSILLSVFTGIAIFIGCLGLLGLATFMANQKTKEIGVRKVLGASVESIVVIFTKEYVRLILIGFAISAPLAWLAMNKWLDNFEYKITIGPMIFIIGFSITLLIALITVGYKSLKAATVNPVNSLKSE